MAAQHPMLLIDPEVARRFPEIKVGVAVIRGISIVKQHPELETLKQSVVERIRRELSGKQLADLPRIQAYRRIYRAFGVDPTSRRPSAEAILRRMLDPSKGLYTVNSVVDCYNLCSAEFQLPMAAYDLDRMVPPVMLRFARQGDVHQGIGQDRSEPLEVGELVYSDQRIVLCRDFNYRDADATKVTEKTKNILLCIDGCDVVSAEEILQVLKTVADHMIRFNRGAIESLNIVTQKSAADSQKIS